MVVNTALLPLGSADRLAVSEPIASPSVSEAVTSSVNTPFSAAVAEAGANTSGGRSELATEIDVAAVVVSALDAVKVTL